MSTFFAVFGCIAAVILCLWSIRRRRCPKCMCRFAVLTEGEWDGLRIERCEVCGHTIETRY
jgi:hypothetical protein